VTAGRSTEVARRLEELSVGELLTELEAPAPSACGGSAAALVGAMAASLVRLVADRAPEWPEAAGVAAQAGALRARLVQLAADDVRAFAAAMEALEAASGAGGSRDHLLGLALERAADVPLAIAAATADVAELAAAAAHRGRPQLRPDATTAALLAEAACRSTVRLVEVNLATIDDDPRTTEARALGAAAADAGRRALDAPS
jgi:formiminotetrahydrofolate cyclodeaminase